MILRFYAAAVGLAAALLFVAQPVVAKLLLPSLGGTAITWIAVMLFFQGLVVLGYLGAHLAVRGLGARRAAFAYVGVLAAGAVLGGLEVAPPELENSAPVALGSVLGSLFIALGVPGLALAASAPSLQAWFASRQNRDPYWLYVSSNLGSLVALIGYPFVVEPLLDVTAQRMAWKGGYLVLLGVAAVCAWLTRDQTQPSSIEAAPRTTWRTRLHWVWLAFVPSSLMLGATTHLTTDLAPVPLLWVLPLAIYLVTYAVAFSRFGLGAYAWSSRLVPLAIAPLIPLTIVGTATPVVPIGAWHLLAILACGLVFHGELYRTRPAPARLTEFYAWLAIGGALGGLFHALAGPWLFAVPLEYPLTLGLALATLPKSDRAPNRLWVAAILLALAGAGLLVSAYAEDPLTGTPISYAPFAIALLPFVLAHRWPRAAGTGLATLLAIGLALTSAARPDLHAQRSLFASYRVGVDQRRGFRYLAHGNTIHGAESLDATDLRALPYHHPESPIAEVFGAVEDDASIAVLGLGVGAMASLVAREQSITFYEIDPVMHAIAREHFSFLRRCDAHCSVRIGDGRVELRRAPDRYALIVMDAFNSSAIPTHLLTREAFDVYLDRLEPGGIIAVHVTNRYVDLEPVLAATAEQIGLRGLVREWKAPAHSDVFLADSRWVVLTRAGAPSPQLSSRWAALHSTGVRAWTDAHASLISSLRW